MQPYFIPYIGYFQLIAASDVFVVFDDVNYINRGWINRNSILLDGKDHLITLPLSKASQNKLINEIEISDEENLNRKKLLKQIEFSYKKAPFFQEFFPVVEGFILNEKKNLVDYLVHSIVSICYYLEIEFNHVLSSAIAKDDEKKGQYKIAEICQKLGAKTYVNAIGGIDMYDRSFFAENGVDLRFISKQEIKYSQFGKEFAPNLSILDVIMFNGKNSASLIKKYSLI